MAKQKQGSGTPKKKPQAVVPFTSNEELLEAAGRLFRLRDSLEVRGFAPYEGDLDEGDARLTKAKTAKNEWHARVRATPRSLYLVDIFNKHRLTWMEREILCLLLLSGLGLWEHEVESINAVLDALAFPGLQSLKALRYLAEEGKLFRTELVYFGDEVGSPFQRDVFVDPLILERVLYEGQEKPNPFNVKQESALYKSLGLVCQTMGRKFSDARNIQRGYSRRNNFRLWHRKLMNQVDQLNEVLSLRPKWKLGGLYKQISNREDWYMVLALLGEALGQWDEDYGHLTGTQLTSMACENAERYAELANRLRSDAFLITEGIVQPCGGDDILLAENRDSLSETEFELTPRTLERLGIQRSQRSTQIKDRDLRESRIKLSNLALSGETLEAIQLAITHAQGADTILKEWGIQEKLQYGLGTTMLFSGIPGTGKTATAEAIAHELQKPLLVANYAEIQNSFVGRTEKNIVNTFLKAARHNAVLFFDEADAMFFDRDASSRTWEVRDVNVLLQELERFEGVCILATNRRLQLDKALERRISIKVEFQKPDREQRHTIWKKLIPRKLPIAEDVDLYALSKHTLTGGEIKNVILNAARFAYARNGTGPVTAEDFMKGIALETNKPGKRNGKAAIGFQA